MRSTQERLAAEQIETLREKYLICGINAPPMVSLTKMNWDKVKEAAETFVYGEVVGDVSTYTVETSVNNDALDEKQKANGIKNMFEFYEYTVVVTKDTQGKYYYGEQITITANVDFIDYNPKLSDGMRIVVPVAEDKANPSRNHYTVDGMYYVTEDGYVLSASDDADVNNGIRVESLMKKLKK